MKILQECCEAGGLKNEDLIWYGGGCAAVLDGSTALGDPSQPDARWLTAHFSHIFPREMRACGNIRQALVQTVRCMRIKYLKDTGVDPKEATLPPSASAGIVHQNGDTVELYSLGDCSVIVHFCDPCAQPVLLRSGDVGRMDRSVLDAMRLMRNERGADIADIVKLPEIRDMLRHNRSRMNTPDGYWILGFDEKAISHGLFMSLPAKDISRIYVHTDGFDMFEERFLSPGQPIDLSTMYDELRRIEREDSGLNRFPRFKLHDDAAALVIGLEG